MTGELGWAAMVHAAGSFRRVQYWTAQGWLRAANAGCGSGRHRRWPAVEARIAELMRRLVDQAGFQPAAAHHIARLCGGHTSTPGAPHTITLAPGIDLTLHTIGDPWTVRADPGGGYAYTHGHESSLLSERLVQPSPIPESVLIGGDLL
jgi:hypothetical protein